MGTGRSTSWGCEVEWPEVTTANDLSVMVVGPHWEEVVCWQGQPHRHHKQTQRRQDIALPAFFLVTMSDLRHSPELRPLPISTKAADLSGLESTS